MALFFFILWHLKHPLNRRYFPQSNLCSFPSNVSVVTSLLVASHTSVVLFRPVNLSFYVSLYTGVDYLYFHHHPVRISFLSVMKTYHNYDSSVWFIQYSFFFIPMFLSVFYSFFEYSNSDIYYGIKQQGVNCPDHHTNLHSYDHRVFLWVH